MKTLKTLIVAVLLTSTLTQGKEMDESWEPELPVWESRETPPERNRGNPIVPPFGLKWGDGPEVVRKWSEEKGYRRKRYQADDKLILEVNGPFTNVKFQIIRFYYTGNALTEVELEYPPQRNESDGLFQLAQVKNQIEGNRGLGRLEPEEKESTESSHWRLNRYTWDDGENLLWLVNFQMKEGNKTSGFKTVSITSLHYRLVENFSTQQ